MRNLPFERHFKRKPQNQHHQPVQAQQARVQQQGGTVQDLYQQHHRNHDQVNNQPQYKYIKVLDLDLLMAGNNIEYVLQNVNHFLGCFPVDRHTWTTSNAN